MQKIKDIIFEVVDNKYKVVISGVVGVIVQKFGLLSSLLAFLGM